MFSRPDADAGLWRYVDFAKFVDLLDRRALFFARADRVGDAWEGSVDEFTVTATEAMVRSAHADTDVVRANARSHHDEAIYRQRLTRFMHMSCWYANQNESARCGRSTRAPTVER